MSEEDFNSMGYDIDFKTFCMPQTLNKMYNEDIMEEMDEMNESLWFLGLEKRNVMRYMLHVTRVRVWKSREIRRVKDVTR